MSAKCGHGWDQEYGTCPQCEDMNQELSTKLRAEFQSRDATMINEWHLNDKAILAEALKEIYAIRGEDYEVAAIVLRALRDGCVPGY